MHSFTAFSVTALLAMGAMARPAPQGTNDWWHGGGTQGGYCLTDDQAQLISDNYGTLIAAYSPALADQVLSPNFTDYSESVNTLINECPQGSAALALPLLAPTFSDRASFELGQGQQPNINFIELQMWHSCDTVFTRWMSTNTAPIPNVRPVVGILALETVAAPASNPFPYYIENVFSEFDAGAWLENLQDAGICANPPAN